MISKLILSVSFLTIALFATAQKQMISIDDFADWKRIENRQISNNGKFIAYELNKQKGDGCLIIYNTETKTNDTIAFGFQAKLSPNSDFIAFKYKPAADSTRAANKEKLKKDKMPKDSLGILNLLSKELTTYTKVKSFSIPKENASWIATLIEHQEPKPDTTNVKDSLDTSIDSVATDTVPKVKKKKEKDLKDLWVQNPISGSKHIFDHVNSYVFSKLGKTLGINTKEKDSIDISTVIAFNTLNETYDTIFRDTGLVKKLCLDKEGQQLSFIFSNDTNENKTYSLYLWNNKTKNTIQIIDTLTSDLPYKWTASENGKNYFSDDGTKLFFASNQKPENLPEDSLLSDEKAKVDVWSWTDKRLQPAQLLSLSKDKKRSYLSVFRIKEKKAILLTDTIVRNIRLINKNNGEIALAWDETPYQRESSWNGKWVNDYYLVDIKTGKKELILKAKDKVYLSPNGKYTVWYNQSDSSYYARDNKSKKSTCLTSDVQVPFYYEENDMPNDPSIYGVAGWTEQNDVLIYDRYDIWTFDLSGKSSALNMTKGEGRKQKIRLRYVKLNNELVYVPSDTDIILSGFDEKSYNEGYYSTNLNTAQSPNKLVKGAYRTGRVQKAKDSEQVIWSTQDVVNYPEIQLSNTSFTNSEIISKANPQQVNYNWATTEQIKWTAFDGEELRGTLYKPENFDSNKKYPMVIYFYERSSEGIHRHYTPYPSHSIINKTFYASNGYLVFVPDITYKIGYPGQSAYNAVVSGAQYLINTFNFIDSDKIGLQGQSWGGYQIAYLVTQTDMFAAAMAGAPVSNMTSAYGGIRWGSGMSRMFQYEHTQSRIGGTLWEKPMLYYENSPVFYAPKVNTPLLIMHNDKDGAVPWYQGIEYFVALRRLNKPAWLLNYNGMKHNIEPKYWANRVDLSERMLQFFNHYLKDEQAPSWMTDGVKAINKI